MINIITKIELLEHMIKENKSLRYVKFPYKRCETVIAYEGGISSEIVNIVNSIDECKLDAEGNIESKFTNTAISLDKLSDGSKTVIYVYYRTIVEKSNEIINITDCGPNAIEYILKNYSDKNLILYLGHLELPMNIKCKFKINNDIVENTNEIFSNRDDR